MLPTMVPPIGVVVVVIATTGLVTVIALVGVTVLTGCIKTTATSVTVFDTVVDLVGTGLADVEACSPLHIGKAIKIAHRRDPGILR